MRAFVLAMLPACGFAPTQAAGGGDMPGTVDAPRGSGDARAIDARAIDAPPDAPKMWKVVDTLTVACVDVGVPSTYVLSATGTYHLRASGECVVNTTNGSKSDAEYFGYNVGPTYDTYNNIDNGIAIGDLTLSASKSPHWGTYNSTDHTYEVPWTGTNAIISASYHDSNDSNNAGSLKLEILSYE